MNLEKVRATVLEYNKKTQEIQKILREISALQKETAGNFSKIEDKLEKIKKIAKTFEANQSLQQILNEWTYQYKQFLEEEKRKFFDRIGIELEKELKKYNLSLEGHYPLLKTTFFQIQLIFEKEKAIVWYGPKQEKLCVLPLSPEKIAKSIDEIRKNLGSKLSDKEYLERLKEAFKKAKPSVEGGYKPIISVLSEISLLIQSPLFQQDPRKENYQSYSRADFSYDLFRITKSTSKVNLRIAPRALTTKRFQFLWIPSNESGAGHVYSHIKVDES